MNGEFSKSGVDLWLASKSPRRKEILAQVGVNFGLLSVEVVEQVGTQESPEDYVIRLAREKSLAGRLQAENTPVLGADTVVVLDGLLLEKPRDEEDAVQMLLALSGRQHQVLTGVALCSGNGLDIQRSCTEVSFREISEEQARRYWATGEPRDKAGAYGIQGLGAVFVEAIRGSYSGVVGLPIECLTPLLHQHKVPYWQL